MMDFSAPKNSTSEHTIPIPSPTDISHSASNFLSENYIVITVSTAFAGVLLIIIIILLIRKIRQRCLRRKLLQTYSSVNYEDESLDEELDNCDDIVYRPCKLYVGADNEDDSDLINSEPEYDCMSVDVSVSAGESSVIDWSSKDSAHEPGLQVRSKISPYSFWKR